MADPDAARLAWVERLAGINDNDDEEPTGTAWDEPDTLDWDER